MAISTTGNYTCYLKSGDLWVKVGTAGVADALYKWRSIWQEIDAKFWRTERRNLSRAKYAELVAREIFAGRVTPESWDIRIMGDYDLSLSRRQSIFEQVANHMNLGIVHTDAGDSKMYEWANI